MTEGTKQKIAGVVIALMFVLGTLGVVGIVYAYKAHAFLTEVMYRDVSGAEITRADVLKPVAQNALQQMLQNAAKAQQEKAKAPTPAPEAPPPPVK